VQDRRAWRRQQVQRRLRRDRVPANLKAILCGIAGSVITSDIPLVQLPLSNIEHFADQLQAAGLQTDDFTEWGRLFWRIADAKGLTGYSGIEGKQPEALLRSVVILPHRRRSGTGPIIVEK